MSNAYPYPYLLVFFLNFLIALPSISKCSKGVCFNGQFPLGHLSENYYPINNLHIAEREVEDQIFSVFSPLDLDYIEVDFTHHTSISNNNFYIESNYYNEINLDVIDDIATAFAAFNSYGLLDNSPIRESEEAIFATSPQISSEVNVLFLDIQANYITNNFL